MCNHLYCLKQWKPLVRKGPIPRQYRFWPEVQNNEYKMRTKLWVDQFFEGYVRFTNGR